MATYKRNEYKENILAKASKVSTDSYYLPTEHMHIKLKPGVTIEQWVDRWIEWRFRNNMTDNTIII